MNVKLRSRSTHIRLSEAVLSREALHRFVTTNLHDGQRVDGQTCLHGIGRRPVCRRPFRGFFSFEERIQLFHLRLFEAMLRLRRRHFLILARVMSHLGYRTFAHYEFNPGIGFRAIARPNVVGRVDIATSKDGNAVFAGLDFPF